MRGALENLRVGVVGLLCAVVLSFGCSGLFNEPEQLAETSESCDSIADCDDAEVCRTGLCVDVSCEGGDCESAEKCYRGRCVDECNETQDCQAHERCYRGRCLPLDCSEAVCDDSEQCYFGACHPACSEHEDCEGVSEELDIGDETEPVCHRGACAVSPCVETDELPDGTSCPDRVVAMVGVDEVEATAATFEGVVFNRPEPVPTDHGFCWSRQPEPTHNDDCISLQQVQRQGIFSTRIDELAPGRTYYVRAFVVVEQGNESTADYADEVAFTTRAPGVSGVEADVAEHREQVEVRWDEVDGAVGYRIYRDSQPVEEVEADQTVWTDETTELTERPSAPGGLSATSGEYSEYVRLSWNAVSSSESVRHNYGIAAIYPDIESGVSEVVSGYVSSPEITGYRVFRDDEKIATVAGTHYEDSEAKQAPRVDAPALSASEGVHSERVVLSWDEPMVHDGEAQSYRVATVYNIDGQEYESDPSTSATGYRKGADIVGYELEVNDEWIPVGDRTEFVDVEAARPTIEPGVVEATHVNHVDYVALELHGASTTRGDTSSYRVRAMTKDGTTGYSSEITEGYTDTGEPEVQWQRSLSAAGENFVDLDGATMATHHDETAPEDGQRRYYRAVVDAEGAAESVTAADYGSRAVSPFSYHAVRNYDDGNHHIRMLDDRGRKFRTIDRGVTQMEIDAQGDLAVVVPGAYNTGETMKLDSSGSELWTYDDHESEPSDIAIDREGNVYTASVRIRKIAEDGNLEWMFEDAEISDWSTVGVHHGGDVYASTSYLSDDGERKRKTVKINGENGEKIWSVPRGSGEMVVGRDGSVIVVDTAEEVGEYGDIFKFDAGAQRQWRMNPDHEINALAVDDDGHVFIGDRDDNMYKLDSDGDEIWHRSERPAGRLVINPEGAIFAGRITMGQPGDFGGEIRKYDSEGQPLWLYELDAAPIGLAVEPGSPGAFADAWDDWKP